MPRPLASTETF